MACAAKPCSQSNGIGSILPGVAGIIWMPLLNSWGRMPVLFWSTLLGASFTLGVVLSPTFPIYYAMRMLQCLTQTTGQTVGLAFIHDCFFHHEYARKIGIWVSIYISAPFWSPLLANFIIGKTGNWHTIYWCVFAWASMLLCLILMFGDETYYNRAVPLEQQPRRPKGQLNRFLRVTGIWQMRHHTGYFATVWSSYLRLFSAFTKPVIPLSMFFYAAVFMWCIGLNLASATLLSTPSRHGGYGLSAVSVAYIYFAPIVGLIVGEFFGHFFNDFVHRLYVKRHQGRFVPEARLWTNYIGFPFIVGGLLIVGFTLQYRLHVAGIVFGWGINTMGVLIASVSIIAFALDCYPDAAVEVSALINMGRAAAGFSVPYFIGHWTAKEGYDVALGLAAVVVAGVYVFLIGIHVFGGRLRKWAGPVAHVRISRSKSTIT